MGPAASPRGSSTWWGPSYSTLTTGYIATLHLGGENDPLATLGLISVYEEITRPSVGAVCDVACNV